MKKLLILTLVATLCSCGKNPGVKDGKKLNLEAKLQSSKSSQYKVMLRGENVLVELNSQLFNQENGVIEFEKFHDELVLDLLAENELEITFLGLKDLKFDGHRVVEVTSTLSNLKRIDNVESIKLNKEEIKKLVSSGIKINLEKITFEVNNVEVSKKFEKEGTYKKTGSFKEVESLESSGAKRYVERFYVAVKSPIYEEVTKNGKIEEFKIDVRIFAAPKSAYVTAVIKNHIGFDFVESDLEFDSFFKILSTENPHKEFKIKKYLSEVRFESNGVFDVKSISSTTYTANKKIPKGHYIKFNDGTSTFLMGEERVEYIEELEVRREIIPLYY